MTPDKSDTPRTGDYFRDIDAYESPKEANHLLQEAADEIERLQAECAEEKKTVEVWREWQRETVAKYESQLAEVQRNKAEQARHCQELMAQLIEARKDAERYRFLAENWHSLIDGNQLHVWLNNNILRCGGFRAAIDRASTGDK